MQINSIVTYDDFLLIVKELRPVVAIFFTEDVNDNVNGFQLAAFVGSSSSVALVTTGTKPASFNQDFPHAVQLSSMPGFAG